VLTVYHYPNCSTCRRALAWLRASGLDHTLVDIVQAPPARATLAAALKLSGLPVRKLMNVSGESYRAGDFKTRLPAMSDAQILDALAADGKLIKRPLAIGADVALVGFIEDAWAAALAP
jgi:arsenate reductase